MNLDGLPYMIEPMRREDVPTVHRIETQVFPLPWSAYAFRYEVTYNGNSTYLVLRYTPWAGERREGILPQPVARLLGRADKDPSLLGYGGFWMMAARAHISTLALRPEWRGRGLGELLLASLCERALQRGARVINLEVRTSNIVAQHLYEKYGFGIIKRHEGYYSDNGEDAYIMSTQSYSVQKYQEHLETLTQRLRERLASQTKEPPRDDEGESA
ncbi:MAG: ribosomal protein S18-alanine N-acetyltransferase [Chloroflexota bacterium]|nr:ribosomal protein S18-alanine N-acetyltransferase [Chloroflexota bacterium]